MKTILSLIYTALFIAGIIHGFYFVCHPNVHPTQGDTMMYFILMAGSLLFLILHQMEEEPEKRLARKIERVLDFLAES
jgi:hypothetical protein